MTTRLMLAMCVLALPLFGNAQDAPKAEIVERLVQDFAFSSTPNLNTKTEFKIRPLEVQGLWEELKIKIFDIEYQIEGTKFNGFIALYHAGEITSFASSGGHGLMSGTMHNREFYYTYSSGSGIHRSHVAKLRIKNGVLEHLDSGGFQNIDLFVTAGPGDGVHVISGNFKDFNKWEGGKSVGTIRPNGSAGILILDSTGEIVEPTFPDVKKSQQSGPDNPAKRGI